MPRISPDPVTAPPQAPPQAAPEAAVTTREALLVQVGRGDAASRSELYDALAPTVYAFSYRITRDHDLAEDLTARVFTDLWQASRDFDPTEATVEQFLVQRVRAGLVAQRRTTPSPLNPIG